MKIKLIILCVLGCLQVQAQEFLDHYLQIAAENNPGLKAHYNLYLAQLEQIPQTKALPDPQVGLGVFINPVETRVGPQRASLSISQSLPWFGTKRSQAEVSTRLSHSMLANFENEKLKLFREVSIAYNQLYFVHKAIAITEENLQVLASFKELARVNFESGKTGFVNVLRVEMEEEEMQVVLASLEDSRQAAHQEFENLLHHSLSEPLKFPDSLKLQSLSVTSEALRDSLNQGNASLQALQHQLGARQQEQKVAKLMGKPNFMVSASYINVGKRTDMEVSDNGKDVLLFPQIGLSIPLASKKYQAMEKQADLEQQSVQYQIEEQTNRYTTQLQHRLKDYQQANRRLILLGRLRDLAQRSLSLLQTEFATGKTDFEEVLRMQRKLLDYQLQSERARVDINNSVYEINYLVGK